MVSRSSLSAGSVARLRLFVAALGVFSTLFLPGKFGGRVLAQAAPQPADQAAIDSAIQRGVQYLKNAKYPAGNKPGSEGGWTFGYAALAGITLIECGTPPSDPLVTAMASLIRGNYLSLDSTYEVALAILFLDRMGEKSDRGKIQVLAGRLIMGQSPTGGWGYKVPNRSREDMDKLLKELRKLSPPQTNSGPSFRARPGSLGLCIKTSDDTALRPAPPPFDLEKAKQAAIAALPLGMKRLPLFLDISRLILQDPKDKGQDPNVPTTDNSNTHFAMLGLWAARKYDVPTDRSFAMLVNRYRTSQGPNGTWDYPYVNGGQNGPPSMTCVALLGLAIGHVLNANPQAPPEKDPLVINAFIALSRQIGAPAGRIDGRPAPDAVGGLYFLWGMERIAVLYDVRQLDNKDWYLWGAEILLGSQSSDGSWSKKGGYPGDDNASRVISNTCFAVLFLKRANLTPDLSRRLTVDTGALTQSLAKTPPPPTPTPTPTPTPAVLETAPPPRAATPKPKIEPTPVVQATPVSSPPPPAPKSNLLWYILLGVLALIGVSCIAFVLLRKKSGDDEDEDENEDEDDRPRKKSKKDKTASGKGAKKKTAGNANGKAKSTAKRLKAEVDEEE